MNNTENQNKKVLIVEDDHNWQEIYRTFLHKKGVGILEAYTLEDAEELLVTHPDVAAIVIDARMGKADLEQTATLIRDIRIRGFTGPMIAASASAAHCTALLGAGCDYEIGGDKERTVPILASALRIPL